MKYTENQRYRRTKIVPVPILHLCEAYDPKKHSTQESFDSECIVTYSKRAAKFDESDFDMPLRDAFSEIHALDDFGIVSLSHGPFEFLIEKTNLGFSIMAFDMGRPAYALDKAEFGLKLGDLV